MTQKEVASELVFKYERKIAMLELQERYLQRKVLTITDRKWQIILGKLQADLTTTKDFLNFLNEICASSELESVEEAKLKDIWKKP